jgi:hypothetical protein
MEMGIAVAIIATLMVMAAWFGMRLIPMAQTVDAVSLASGPKTNEVIYHAVHGRWPSPDNPHMIGDNGNGRYARHLTLDAGGVITAELVLDPVAGSRVAASATGARIIHGSLSFRPELLGNRDAPTIVFICGYAKPVMGRAATSGVNKTTLDRKFLPPFCR